MGRWLTLFTAIVSAGLSVLFIVNLFTGSPVPKTWVAAFFLLISLGLAALSAGLLRQK